MATYGRGSEQYRTPAQREMAERAAERNKQKESTERTKRAIAARRVELAKGADEKTFFSDSVKVKR